MTVEIKLSSSGDRIELPCAGGASPACKRQSASEDSKCIATEFRSAQPPRIAMAFNSTGRTVRNSASPIPNAPNSLTPLSAHSRPIRSRSRALRALRERQARTRRNPDDRKSSRGAIAGAGFVFPSRKPAGALDAQLPSPSSNSPLKNDSRSLLRSRTRSILESNSATAIADRKPADLNPTPSGDDFTSSGRLSPHSSRNSLSPDDRPSKRPIITRIAIEESES